MSRPSSLVSRPSKESWPPARERSSKIPAGQIGNERDIEIVSERWYSPELKMVIMTRHSDPRAAESTFRLTNIRRTDPDPSLFQVPSDYTIKDRVSIQLRTNGAKE